VQTVEQVPKTKLRTESRAGHALRIVLGLTLLTIAALYILALIEVTSYLIVTQVGMYSNSCRLFLRTRNVAFLVAIIYLGLNLLATPKKPVLFLRRFGLDLNSVVSRVIRRGLGRQFRFVTLDDGRFPAIDIPALERWATRLGPPVIAIAVVLGALAARDDFSHRGSSNGAYGQAAAQMIAAMGYWIAIFWTLVMLAWVHSLRMRRKSRYGIRNEEQLRAFLFETRLLGRWRLRLSLLRPQAVVAKVSDSLWQQCVSQVAEQVGMVLIDISEPTPNLQWEIERLRTAALQCVFIAERSRLQCWFGGDRDSSMTTAGASVARLVADDCVLLYQADHKLGGASFRPSLQQLLRKAAKQAPPQKVIKFPLMDRLWRMSISAIFHGFILFTAMASGAILGMLVFLGTATN